MSEYEYQLNFKLDQNEDANQYLDALYESGCDDATIGIGVPGFINLDFTRTAEDPLDALSSSILNFAEAIPHAKLIRATPYIMNLSELGIMFGCTKQNMSKYARGKAASSAKNEFPVPVVLGKNSYWYTIDVANWLNENSSIVVDLSTLEILHGIFTLNALIAKENRKCTEVNEDFSQLVERIA